MKVVKSSPSPASVILKIFAITFIIFVIMLYHNYNKPDELEKRLYELGYPREGYIVLNGTVKFSDGHMIKFEGSHIEAYPITAGEALKKAKEQLDYYNEKLEKYNLKLEVDTKSLNEVEENGKYYFVFEIYLKKTKGVGKGFFAGFVYVDRQTGLVKSRGLLD